MKHFRVAVSSIALLLISLANVVIPAQAQAVSFGKSRFTDPVTIDNAYFPLVPGTTFIYNGTTDRKASHEEFVVTHQTRTIKGIQTRVVHDTNWENGKLVEDTFDWFAQDDAGNVWYFGELSTQYKNGKIIGHQGSWEAGVGGASEGIVMKARPKVGDTYRQETAPGIAADTATVLSLDQSTCVSYGCFSNVLKTKEFSPLEPGVTENKYYAPGIGEIKSIMVAGGSEESELIAVVSR